MKKIDLIINPITCMLFGTAYYIIIPSLFYFNDYYGLDFIINVVSPYLNSHSNEVYLYNVFDFFIINFSFILGFLFTSLIKSNSKEVNISFDGYIILPKFILGLLAVVLFFLLVKSRILGYQFFRGYDSYEIAILGPLATLCFMCMWFYIYFNKKYFLVMFFIVGILLLGSGSRMFFLLPLLSLILMKVLTSNKLLKYVFFVFIVVIFMLTVGLAREGSKISFDGFLTILFAEPIFTSIGTLFYFGSGRPEIGFPVDIVAAVMNFIPSILFTDKQVIIEALTFSKEINNPFGAQSLLINLYKNFGYIYPVFIFLLGIYFGFLYNNRGRKLFFTIYIMSLPLILLHFQREGFITVLKVLFFNGLFLPLMLITLFGMLLRRV